MEIVEQFPCEALDKVFKKLAEYADSKTLTKEEQEKYDNSMMVMWDNYAVPDPGRRRHPGVPVL